MIPKSSTIYIMLISMILTFTNAYLSIRSKFYWSEIVNLKEGKSATKYITRTFNVTPYHGRKEVHYLSFYFTNGRCEIPIVSMDYSPCSRWGEKTEYFSILYPDIQDSIQDIDTCDFDSEYCPSTMINCVSDYTMKSAKYNGTRLDIILEYTYLVGYQSRAGDERLWDGWLCNHKSYKYAIKLRCDINAKYNSNIGMIVGIIATAFVCISLVSFLIYWKQKKTKTEIEVANKRIKNRESQNVNDTNTNNLSTPQEFGEYNNVQPSAPSVKNMNQTNNLMDENEKGFVNKRTDNLSTLTEMGFEKDSALLALNHSNNNINGAIQYLLSISSSPMISESINTNTNECDIGDNKENITTDKDKECVVCMHNIKDHICVPCGHMCLCKDCKNMIDGKCPMCQAQCTIVRVFS
eukprot:554236_1